MDQTENLQKYFPNPAESHLRTGILFQERDENFLYISTLGAGCQGQALLVRHVNGNGIMPPTDEERIPLFVRKRAVRRKGATPGHSTPPEIRYPRPVPATAVPVTHFWKPYSESDQKHDFALVQKFCNGGSLAELCEKFENSRKWIPEVFLWAVLGSLCQLIAWLHRKPVPPVAHSDIHLGNVFLHYTNKDNNPDIYLGDFGYAVSLAADDITNDKRQLLMTSDIHKVANTVLDLMAAGFGPFAETECESENFEEWLDETPYSERLKRVVACLHTNAEEYYLDSRQVWEQFVKSNATAWQQKFVRTVPQPEWSVTWTRPAPNVTPLLLSDRDLADLSITNHELRYKILGDQDFTYGTEDKGVLGIIPPFSYVLVDPSTLQLVRIREWQEIAALGLYYKVTTIPMGYRETNNIRDDPVDFDASRPEDATMDDEEDDEEEEEENEKEDQDEEPKKKITDITDEVDDDDEDDDEVMADADPEMELVPTIERSDADADAAADADIDIDMEDASASGSAVAGRTSQQQPPSSNSRNRNPSPPEAVNTIGRSVHRTVEPLARDWRNPGMVGGWTVVNPPLPAPQHLR